VVAAIERQARLLASTAADDERLKALKYVVHLVADVHQPLHGGFVEDRGGNQYQVQAFGKGTNLHALWDVGLVEQWPGGLEALKREVASAQPGAASLGPSDWAEASCRIVSSDGFYPEGRQVGEEYRSRWASTLVVQLARAAQRLARILNDSLGKP
jgi:hypothetical protein